MGWIAVLVLFGPVVRATVRIGGECREDGVTSGELKRTSLFVFLFVFNFLVGVLVISYGGRRAEASMFESTATFSSFGYPAMGQITRHKPSDSTILMSFKTPLSLRDISISITS
ncbi:hypothetical protein BD410DRAFT_788702 [Rickenella mellea]|uniref:Uncharacterized protein n=1 Tax=Rickenella mellea TaxID=50990 RepID=A0A4Y7Q6C3_9AGAM|nr:hypothetical protein BD410DRAFT_788702 [Rickenella mellea]